MSPILVQLLVDTWSGWAVSGTASLKKPWVMDTIWPFLLSWLSITFKFYLLPPLPTPSIFPQAADTPAHFIWYICMPPCFPGGSEVKAFACNAGDLGSIPGLGRSPGEGNGTPLQYSCLENPMGRGAWWATVHGVAKSRTWPSDFHFTSLQVNIKIKPANV